jgi:hypothetical protein
VTLKHWHCNVSRNYKAAPSLGRWCSNIRVAYKKIQQGQKCYLSQDQIERLEEIGFKWNIKGKHNKETFEQHFNDLEAFIDEFGHCIVPSKYSADPALGIWCKTMRYDYNQIQPTKKLTQDQIERLEEIGFKWKLR